MDDNARLSKRNHSLSSTNWDPEWSVSLENKLGQNASRLEEYMDRLLWWNKRVNLVSRDVSRETLTHHVLHSTVPTLFLSQNAPIVDVGTGGGLPGLVLAILNPNVRVVLNDVQQKKCRVLKEMARSLSCDNVEVVEGDLMRVTYPEPCQVVSRHAFKLNALFTAIADVKWKRIAVLKGVEDIPVEWRQVSGDLRSAISDRAKILDGCAGRIFSLELLGSDPYWKGKGVLVLKA